MNSVLSRSEIIMHGVGKNSRKTGDYQLVTITFYGTFFMVMVSKKIIDREMQLPLRWAARGVGE